MLGKLKILMFSRKIETILLVSIGLQLFIYADVFILPKKESKEEILNAEFIRYDYRRAYTLHYHITTNKDVYEVPVTLYNEVAKGEYIFVHKSYITTALLTISHSNDNIIHTFNIGFFTFFGDSLVWLVLLTTLTLVMVFFSWFMKIESGKNNIVYAISIATIGLLIFHIIYKLSS